jgi:hypothetical protein
MLDYTNIITGKQYKMQNNEMLKKLTALNQKSWDSLLAGTTICSTERSYRNGNEERVMNFGTIKKMNRKSIKVELLDINSSSPMPRVITGWLDDGGYIRWEHSKFSSFNIGPREVYMANRNLPLNDAREVEKWMRDQFNANAKQVSAERDAKANEAKIIREAAEAERRRKIDKFWNEEGKAIMDSRKTVDLDGGRQMLIFQRPETTRDGNVVSPKIVNAIVTICEDRYDFTAKEENRPRRQVMEIQISGFELRRYEGVESASSFSSSSYTGDVDTWKEFLYGAFGGW